MYISKVVATFLILMAKILTTEIMTMMNIKGKYSAIGIKGYYTEQSFVCFNYDTSTISSTNTTNQKANADILRTV